MVTGMIPVNRPILASVLAWVIGTTAAVGVGVVALSLIGDGLAARPYQPLSQDTVVPQGAPSTGTPIQADADGDKSAKVAPSTAADTAPGAQRMINAAGGTVIARCSGTDIYLVSWSPAQGYRVGEVERGPAHTANVHFVGGDHHDAEVELKCVAGVPELDDHHDDGDTHADDTHRPAPSTSASPRHDR